MLVESAIELTIKPAIVLGVRVTKAVRTVNKYMLDESSRLY